jgi:2-polyprenyl-6-methoxyphenol hydroxylase-like FAD-dependent oxidoreductase
MKILIVGGGVGGPALASFLAADPRFDITLVEQAPEFKNIGYGISMWPNGLSILEKLGLRHVIEKSGYELPWLLAESSSQHMLNYIFFRAFSAFGPTLVLPRAEVHGALIERLRSSRTTLRLGSKIASVSQTGDAAQVTFADGSVESFDLIIGADGIHSKVRESIFGTDCLHDYGWNAWVFWVDGSDFSRGIVEIPRRGSVCFTYPTLDRSFMMVAEKSSADLADVPARAAELKKLADLYSPTARANILQAAEAGVFFYDKLRHVHTPAWHKGRVVIIGDAKHAASPITGMGASMALEDAFVLSEELKSRDVTTRGGLQDALEAFSARRDKRLRKFRAICQRLEGWAMASGEKAVLRDLMIRWMPSSYFSRPLKRLLASEL